MLMVALVSNAFITNSSIASFFLEPSSFDYIIGYITIYYQSKSNNWSIWNRCGALLWLTAGGDCTRYKAGPGSGQSASA